MFERVSAIERLQREGRKVWAELNRAKAPDSLQALMLLGEFRCESHPPLQFVGSWFVCLPVESAPLWSSGSPASREAPAWYLLLSSVQNQASDSRGFAPQLLTSFEWREIVPLFLYSWHGSFPWNSRRLCWSSAFRLAAACTQGHVVYVVEVASPSFTAIHLCK